MHTDIREVLKEAKIEKKIPLQNALPPSFDFVKRGHL
jgi:hypothetical protein